MRRLRARTPSDTNPVDLVSSIGSVTLPNPVMTASGTAGHGDELGRYLDLGALGAMVVKSLAAEPWAGNPAPRVHETAAGMINSVGLAGPGVEAWVADELPVLLSAGARVVASIWGRTVDDYERAASMLAGVSGIIAVEVNLSCPNLGASHQIFAHDPVAAAEAIAATRTCGRPLWAKLSPNTDRLVSVAESVIQAGAEAVTLVNTVMGMVIDTEARWPLLGGGGGGVSGPAIHPVAVRAVYDCRSALPDVPIIGVGGVGSGRDAVELMMAGADAIQVGTASFADPRSAERVLDELDRWCRSHGVAAVRDLRAAAHEHGATNE